jgi:UDP-2,3-diacylglucosamine hydrolase
MSIRLISDLHLDEKRPALCQAFFNYLDALPQDTEALYILGDFFEVWVGDDDDLPFHLAIMQKLKQKTAEGLPIFFMHGNRDFLVGKYFELKTGCILLPDPFILDYENQHYLLMHGDSLCIEDIDYQQFRQQIRHPEAQAQLLKKSLDERRAFAKHLRDNSQMANSNKAEAIMDVTQSEVERVMQEYGMLTLIHGHTHRPATHHFTINNQSAKRIVLGDWHNTGWEAIINNQQVMLNEFNL